MPQSRSENLGLLLKPIGHVQVQRTLGEVVKVVDNLSQGGGGGAGYSDADARSAVASAIDAASLEEIEVADATDEASAVTLANANKAAINSIIAALKNLTA